MSISLPEIRIGFLLVGLLSVFALQGSAAEVSPVGVPQASAKSLPPRIKIVLVGDSTTAPRTGWGGAFCHLHVFELAACLVIGRGGRSTRTYRTDGSWDLALNELRAGDYGARYMLIELGQNDATSDRAIGTDIDAEFPANLERFVEEVREAGGVPVLLTPVANRRFVGGRLTDAMVAWSERTRAVATRSNAVLVDLNAASATFFQQIGAREALKFELQAASEAEILAAEEGTTAGRPVPANAPVSVEIPADDKRRFYRADYIHLNRCGGTVIANLVARELLKALPETSRYVFADKIGDTVEKDHRSISPSCPTGTCDSIRDGTR